MKLLRAFFLSLSLLIPLLFFACGEGEKEVSEHDAKWAEREEAYKDLVQQDKMKALDFSGAGDREVAAPELKAERTEEEILKEPLRNMTLGVMGPESGELEDYGKKTLNGVILAVDEVNAAGGVGGTTVQLLHRDTSGTVSGALNAADAMIQENVLAIIGSPTGEVTFSATKPLNDTRTILFSAGTRRRIGDTGIYHFRNTMPEEPAVGELIRYCVQDKGFKNFAVFTSMVNDFSIEVAAYVKSTLMLQGGKIVKELFLWPETTTYISEDQSSILAQVKTLKEGDLPDAFIFTSDLEEGLKVLGALREEGIKIPFAGGEDLVTDQFLQEAGKRGIGVIAYAGFDPNCPEPHVQKFMSDYQKRFGVKPDRIAALAYDAARMVLQSAASAPSLRSGHLRKEILKIRGYRGVTGLTSFSDIGEVTKQPFIFEVREKGGKPEFTAVTGYR